MNKDEFFVDAGYSTVEEDDRLRAALLKWVRRAFSSPDVVALRISRVYGRVPGGSTPMNKLQLFLRRVFGTTEILEEMKNVSREMDHLSSEVAQARSVMASANTLITNLAALIRANASDPVALEALANDLDSSAAALSAVVTENTPAANLGGAETAPSDPPVDEPAPVDPPADGGAPTDPPADTGGGDEQP